MKTFLVWGVQSELSEELCLELARGDRRLLVAGDNPEKLVALDAMLAQSELHRYRLSPAYEGLAEWVKSQRAGLDGLLLFPKGPDLDPSTLLPQAKLQALFEASVGLPTQVLRELLPQLERGKKPKPIWIVLDWAAPGVRCASGWSAILLGIWRSYVKELALELASKGLVVNALFPGPLISHRPDASAVSTEASAAADGDAILELPAAPGALGVLAVARTAARLLDVTAGTLSGQLLELGVPA